MPKFPIRVRLVAGAPLWEPRSLQNFWKVGDVSEPLGPNTDISAIEALVQCGRLAVVEGSLEDEAPATKDKSIDTNIKPKAKEPKATEPEAPKVGAAKPEASKATKKASTPRKKASTKKAKK